jgi:hypothetical protein
MNINKCNRNVDVLNCSLRYWLFDCSYLKADTKYSRVFVDWRPTKLYSREIICCRQVPFRKIDMDMSYTRMVRTASLTSYPVRCKILHQRTASPS